MPDRNGFIDFRAVKAGVTMEQVLDHYGLKAKLRVSGNDSLTGCCPLHEGHNPTQFRVSLSKNCWNCFSKCQCGGNVLDFIAKKENVSINEAAHLAVKWFNVVIDEAPLRENHASSNRGAPPPPRVQPAPISAPAKSVPSAEPEPDTGEPNKPLAFELKNLDPAHPYFAERGLSQESIECFSLGHCKKGILNGRIAIPVHNGSGELVAYAGRWPGQPPDDRPKYQFPKGFRKSQEVFNLHRARQSNDDGPLIIVEGFFDCMKVWQAGIERVVALMGSALSPTQEELIAQAVGPLGHIALMFDDDDAGHSARDEALKRFASRAYVRVIELRNFGKQPDELSTDQIRELLLQDDIAEYSPETSKFALGRLVATPSALTQLTELDIRTALTRHTRGDWGDVCDQDRNANDTALAKGERLVSVYHSPEKVKFYVITEWDRSITTGTIAGGLLMQTIDDSVGQVLHGDCIEVLEAWPNACIDLIVTDPPYLASYQPRDGRKCHNDDRDDWLEPAFRAIHRVLKPDRLCVTFYGWPHIDRFMLAWRACGFRPVSHIVGVKSHCSRTGYTQGHHEVAYLLAKGRPAMPSHPPSDVLPWRYTGNLHHPMQKPVEALTPLVEAYSQPGDIVLDPFAGSGATGLAARELRRRFILIEKDAGYCAAARLRLAP